MGRDQTEDRLLGRNTLQNEIAERLYCVSRKERCHLSRAHSNLLHALGDRFQAADEIDRRANHREVEAIGTANVAVSDRPDVQTADFGSLQQALKSAMNHLISQSFL